MRKAFTLGRIALVGGLYAVAALLFIQSQSPVIAFAMASAILGVSLVVLSLIDIETFRLPDVLTIPLALAGCISVWPLVAEDVAWRAVSAGVGYAVLFLFSTAFLRLRGYPGLGLGDAKLLAASGAWTGLEGLPSVLLLACVMALAVVLAAICAGRSISLQTRLPFGPFLAFATWIVWFRGPLV